MKCNPWRWLWGLLPIALLGWIAVLAERSRVEADLTRRVKQGLESTGQAWVNVTFDGRDAILTGRAIDEADPPKALGSAQTVWGVRIVDNRTGLIDRVERYEWSAIRRDNRIRLDGLVPSDKSRRDVIGMAKATFPSLEIDDRMKLARGAPPLDAWIGGVGFGLRQLSQLKQGRVDLEQTNLSISGDAADARGYRSVKSALSKGLPAGVRLKQEAVKPPLVSPFVWTARLSKGAVVFDGVVPSDAVRELLLSDAARLLKGVRIEDRMEPAEGAPTAFYEAASGIIGELGRLEDATATIRDLTTTITGTAARAAEADAALAGLRRAIPSTFRPSHDIGHREPVLPLASPYVTTAVFDGRTLALRGVAPGEDARAALLAAARARFPGRDVRDEMTIARGQPEGWLSCLTVGLGAIGQLAEGRLTLSDSALELRGTTDQDRIVTSAPVDVRQGVGASCRSDVRIALSDAELRRRAGMEARQKAEEEERLRAASDAQRRAAEEAEARRRAEDEARRRGSEEMQRRAAAEAAAADARRRLEAETRLRVEEEARRRAAEEAQRRAAAEAAAAEARRAADAEARRRSEEEQRRLASEQRRREIDVCQQALSSIVREGVINFDRARAVLHSESFRTLDRLAEAANRCPTLKVEIEGHTDSDGTPERNQRLSQRRAEAVAAYLIEAGVERARLTTIGYGETRAVAPNDTPENKARNRRIEFTVKSD